MSEIFAGINQIIFQRNLLATRAKRAAEDLGASQSQADNLVRIILDLNNQARIEAAKQIVQQIEQGDLNGAKMALKLFSSNHGYFSPAEKKQLNELIESLAPEPGSLGDSGEIGKNENNGEEFSGLSEIDLKDLMPPGYNG